MESDQAVIDIERSWLYSRTALSGHTLASSLSSAEKPSEFQVRASPRGSRKRAVDEGRNSSTYVQEENMTKLKRPRLWEARGHMGQGASNDFPGLKQQIHGIHHTPSYAAESHVCCFVLGCNNLRMDCHQVEDQPAQVTRSPQNIWLPLGQCTDTSTSAAQSETLAQKIDPIATLFQHGIMQLPPLEYNGDDQQLQGREQHPKVARTQLPPLYPIIKPESTSKAPKIHITPQAPAIHSDLFALIRDSPDPPEWDTSDKAYVIRFAKLPLQRKKAFAWHLYDALRENLQNNHIGKLNAALFIMASQSEGSLPPLLRTAPDVMTRKEQEWVSFCNTGIQQVIEWRISEPHYTLLQQLDLSQPNLSLSGLSQVNQMAQRIYNALKGDQQVITSIPFGNTVQEFGQSLGAAIPIASSHVPFVHSGDSNAPSGVKSFQQSHLKTSDFSSQPISPPKNTARATHDHLTSQPPTLGSAHSTVAEHLQEQPSPTETTALMESDKIMAYIHDLGRTFLTQTPPTDHEKRNQDLESDPVAYLLNPHLSTQERVMSGAPLLRDLSPPSEDNYSLLARCVRYAQCAGQKCVDWRATPSHVEWIVNRSNKYGRELLRSRMEVTESLEVLLAKGFAERSEQWHHEYIAADVEAINQMLEKNEGLRREIWVEQKDHLELVGGVMPPSMHESARKI